LSLSSSEIVRQLKTFDIDAGLTYLDGDPIDNMHSLPLYDERHLLLVGDDLPGSDIGRVTWEEAAEMPLCLLTRDMQNRRIVDSLFATAGVHPSPRIETNSISALLSHVRFGNCASVVPQSWLQSLGVPAGTHILRFSDGDVVSRVGLVWLGGEPEPALTRALLDVAGEVELQPILDGVLGEDIF
jgi:DNA-binding transcriptional LysR family regulator